MSDTAVNARKVRRRPTRCFVCDRPIVVSVAFYNQKPLHPGCITHAIDTDVVQPIRRALDAIERRLDFVLDLRGITPEQALELAIRTAPNGGDS